MPGKVNRTTPTVISGILYTDDAATGARIGTVARLVANCYHVLLQRRQRWQVHRPPRNEAARGRLLDRVPSRRWEAAQGVPRQAGSAHG